MTRGAIRKADYTAATALAHIESLIEQTEIEADEIAYTMPKVKGLVATKLQQQADEVNRRYQALTSRKIDFQDSLALELTDSVIDDLMQFRETVAGDYKTLHLMISAVGWKSYGSQ